MNLFYNRPIIRQGRHSFAQKMKSIMTIACILGSVLMWSADALSKPRYGINLGIGVSTSMNGSVTFTMEHPFSDRWSMSASAGVSIRQIKDPRFDETDTHHKEFDDTTERSPDSSHAESFSFSYWPQSVNKGIAVSIGAEHLGNAGFDAIFGISYRIPIWKGLSADIRWQTRCIRPIIYGTKDNGTAGLNLYYRF